jgi:RimJ/RimL family protein N-acetyltransferase
MFQIPELRTERLILRAYRPDDWDALSALNADMDFRATLGGNLLSAEQSWAQMETALGQWALRGYGLFAVEHAGRFIGRVGILHPAEFSGPEIAWGIAPEHWGRGFATEAAIAARDWARDERGLSRLISLILPDNHRSQSVARKLGAVIEGADVVRGFTVDVWVHPDPSDTRAA